MLSLRAELRSVLLAGAVFASALIREHGPAEVTQAVVWLPSGVAVAGVWILGWRAWWAIAVAVALQRLTVGYGLEIAAPAACGSVLEAWLGATLLRRLGLNPDFARLRDVLALLVAAAIAPLGSILASGIARALPGNFREMPFYSGWDGWWRMNALGLLTAVPVVLTWHRSRHIALRSLAEGLGVLAVMLGGLWALMNWLPPGPNAILLLHLVLPVALYAALRFGSRGAVTVAAAGVIYVATASALGGGAFMAIPLQERHVAVQIFGLTFVAVPLVFGALIAERGASIARWQQTQGQRDALLSVLPDVTYRLGLDGTFLGVVVPEGVAPPAIGEPLVGRRLVDIVPPALSQQMLDAIAAAHRGERPWPVEYSIDTGDGVVDREARYARLAAGEVLCLVRDITVRKRTERTASWQAGILEQIATGRSNAEIFAAIVHGIETFHERSLCSILLIEGPRITVACAPSLPREFNTAVASLDATIARGSCGTAVRENRTVVVDDIAESPLWTDYRALALRHDLRACWSVPMRDALGTALGSFAIYHRQPRAPSADEIALVERAAVLAGIAIERERREGLLASINRNVQDGIFRSVPGRGLVYANEALARLFGYPTPEHLMQASAVVATLADSAPLLAHDPHLRDLRRLVAGELDAHGQVVEFRRRDGGVFFGLVSSTSVAAADGSSAHRDGAIADVSARRQLEEQLRQAQKMEAVGKLAGGIAHDFNNLLTAITGYAESVRDRLPGDSELRPDLEEVLRAGERAAALTRQLLAFSRQQVLMPRVHDLAEVVEQLAGMLRRLIAADVHLALDLDPQALVRVDRSQIEQVVLNLVVNARDAMPRGGTLTVAVNCVELDVARADSLELGTGSHVLLRVGDTGVGMSREVLARAFDPFFTTKPLGKGTGLGLSTVYGIVKQSGGAIRLESALGFGSTVSIYLPAVATEVSGEPVAVIPRPAAVQHTVLVAEDERLVRDLMQRSLEHAGYRVVAAADGVAALALLEMLPGGVDLLVTDVVMPTLGGRELAERMVARFPDLPVLFVSGYAEGIPALASAAGGTIDFLEKPFTAAQLCARVANLLAVRARA